ncbi:Pantoate-beta-alanine ligase [Zychaea mexicana]|uniref:Pantoate-beta-alanine ligase n=1 Tax=Zychaea mexicana TaxID=64656 RepID=UPI0022FE4178|nr:Pantoate-beta-alanine ligase [Zychaea mexicana]KAI9493560.1 Pantoate-beta-alanine ligase [Zychaea mexicana]
MNGLRIPPGIQVFNSIKNFRQWRRQILLDRQTLGYVPTMGALHRGHLSLVSKAKAACDHVALTIFVNPAQFSPNEDLGTYPRTLQADLDALAQHLDKAAVLVPQVAEMYPSGIEPEVSKQVGAFVEVKGFSHQLEGTTRPHFFRGVATVVSKFLNIVEPEQVFFGQKDAQQCVVIQRMIHDLHFNVKMNICSTVRESDGLAMSSRNTYLTPIQRKYALVLYNALKLMEEMYEKSTKHAPTLIAAATELVNRTQQEAQAECEIKLDYISIASPKDLNEVKGDIADGCIMSGAVYVGKTRLIDNLMVNVNL